MKNSNYIFANFPNLCISNTLYSTQLYFFCILNYIKVSTIYILYTNVYSTGYKQNIFQYLFHQLKSIKKNRFTPISIKNILPVLRFAGFIRYYNVYNLSKNHFQMIIAFHYKAALYFTTTSTNSINHIASSHFKHQFNVFSLWNYRQVSLPNITHTPISIRANYNRVR